MEHRKLYRSYLLRAWGTPEGDTSCWRASLTAVDDGAVLHFASLADLCAFLATLELSTAAQPSPPQPTSEPPPA